MPGEKGEIRIEQFISEGEIDSVVATDSQGNIILTPKSELLNNI